MKHLNRILYISLLWALFAFTCVTGFGDVLYVKSNVSGSQNGESWETAFRTISAAINKASVDDEIWVANGTYNEYLVLKPSIALYGGFEGTETERTQRYVDSLQTIINPRGEDFPFDVFAIVDAANMSMMDGFVISGDHSFLSVGVNIENEDFELNHCVIENVEGTALSALFSSLMLNQCTIRQNRFEGMFINNSMAAIIDCRIHDNGGGGLYFSNSNSHVINSLIYDNSSEFGGSAITIDYSSVEFLNCTIARNSNPYGAGGIDISGVGVGETIITNSILWNKGTEISVGDISNVHVQNSCVVGGWPGEGNIGVYPEFVDPENGDYRLEDGSLCIDSGLASEAPSADIDGTERMATDNVVDMGAFESPDAYTPQPIDDTPDIVYVWANASANGDGISWGSAYRTIGEALKFADSRTEIWVAAGTYREFITCEPGVDIYGGFSGTESQRDEREWEQNETIIDSSNLFQDNFIPEGVVIDSNHARIDGLRIKGGEESYISGIYCTHESFVAANCIITGFGNSGIYCGSTPFALIEHCTIEGNQLSGALINNSTVTFADCSIKKNSGSGINTFDSNIILRGTLITENVNDENGGGIYSTGGHCTIINSVVANNQSKSHGGAIASDFATLDIQFSTIAKNMGDLSTGGIYIVSQSDIIIQNSILSNEGVEITPIPEYSVSETALNSLSIQYSCITGDWEGVGNIGAYPFFVDAQNNDFQLMNGSPCIDSATLIEGITFDFSGNSRPGSDGMVDMGAFETLAEFAPDLSNLEPVILAVRADAPSTGDGLSWINAYNTITEALEYAKEGDEIWVASGTYRENIQMEPGVSMYGGFAGSEIALDDRELDNNHSIIRPSNSSKPIVVGVDAVTFDGFKITGGEAGGLQFWNGASTQVNNCVITQNSFDEDNYNSYYDGGISCSNASPTFTNCVIDQNTSSMGGGGIQLENGSHPVFTRCSITNNKSFSNGGGISSFDANLSMNQCLIHKNRAEFEGGGFYITSGEVVLTNCIVSENNTFVSGGAIFLEFGGIELIHCTIANNTGQLSTGGLLFNQGSLRIISSILWNRGSELVMLSGGEEAEIITSCIADGWPGNGNISVFPDFVDFENGDYHLQNSSPCIDAGLVSAAPSLDYEGNVRPGSDARVDMGAYESADEFTPDLTKVEKKTIYYVRSNAPEGGNGTSWESAFNDINSAMPRAGINTEIWVAEGNYNETVIIESGIALYGGFDGTESGRDQRDWNNNETIIDGSGLNHAAVIASDQAILDGFTIRGSPYRGILFSSGADMIVANCLIEENNFDEELFYTLFDTEINPYFGGGGIYCENSSPQLIDCIIQNNYAMEEGGGVSIREGSNPVFTRCTIESNHSDYSGGGIYSFSGTMITLNNCTISHNTSFEGGGIVSNGGQLLINNSLIYGNQCEFTGHALYLLFNSDVQLNHCVITGNSFTVIDDEFGDFIDESEESAGIYAWGSNLQMEHCIVRNNSKQNIYVGEEDDTTALKITWSNIEGGFEGEGNIDLDPKFNHPWDGETADFHLQPDSPCVDAGNPLQTNNDGCRPPGNGTMLADIGAYGGPLNCGWIESGDIPSILQPEEKVTTLEAGQASSGVLSVINGTHRFEIQPTCDALLLSLDTDMVEGNVELYARRHIPPSRFQYDLYDPSSNSEPHQELVLTRGPVAEPWHILVVATDLPKGPANFTIKTECIDLLLSDMTPETGVNRGEIAAAIKGAGFYGDLELQLRSEQGHTIMSKDYDTANSERIDAWFDLTDAPLGSYDLRVRRVSDNAARVMANALTVIPGAIGSRLETRLDIPTQVRVGRTYTMWVEYANTGDTDMRAPLLSVTSTSNTPISLSPDEPIDASTVWFLGVSFNGTPTVLKAGDTYRIPIYFKATPEIHFVLSRVDSFAEGFWDETPWASYEEYYDMILFAARRLALRGTVQYSISDLEKFALDLIGGEPVSAITGWVRRFDTGQPLADVGITAFDDTGEQFSFANTDRGGFFSIEDLPQGEYEFDVDGHYQPTPVRVNVPDDKDVNGVNVYVQPLATPTPTPVVTPTPLPDTDPSLTTDSNGQAQLVWNRGEDIWHARYENGDWTVSGKIPDATGTNPHLVSDAKLMGDDQNQNMVIWQRGFNNDTEFFYSVGRLQNDNSTYEWTQPIQLTEDTVGDSQPALHIMDDGSVLLAWLKQDWEIEDDTDLYYMELDPEVDDLQWFVPQPAPEKFLMFEDDIQYANLSLDEVCVGFVWGGDDGFSIPEWIPWIGGKYNYSITGESCATTGKCVYTGTNRLTATIHLSKLLKIAGAGQISKDWQAKKVGEKCVFILQKSSISVAGGTSVRYPVWQGKLKIIDFEANIVLTGNLTLTADWKGRSPSIFHKPTSGSGMIQVGLGGEIVAKAPAIKAEGSGLVIGSVGAGYSTQTGWGPKYCGRVIVTLKFFGGWFETRFIWQGGNECPPPSEDLNKIASRGTKRRVVRTSQIIDGAVEEQLIEFSVNPTDGTGNVYGYPTVLDNINNDIKGDGAPAIARSQAGETLITWTKDSIDPFDKPGTTVLVSAYNGTNWSEPVEVDSNDNFNQNPVLAFDSNNNPMVVWSRANAMVTLDSEIEDIEENMEQFDIYYSRRINGNWTAPQALAVQNGRDGELNISAHNNQIVLSWLNYTEAQTQIYSSIWDGNQWSAAHVISNSSHAKDPSCTFADGKPMVAWSQDMDNDENTFEDERLFFSLWDKQWSAPKQIEIPKPETTENQAKTGKRPKIIANILEQGSIDPPPTCCPTKTPTPTPKECEENSAKCTPEATAQPTAIQPIDPNEKVGPLGNGAPNYAVPITQELEYIVYFENQSSASAAAAQVEIIDQLDPDLDWDTFELKAYSFGNRVIALEDNLNHHYTRETVDFWTYLAADQVWAVSGEAALDIQASINTNTGEARWLFTFLDPETGTFPEDPFAGFLPPELEKGEEGYGRGQGYVIYTIRPRADIVPGTQVTNFASIVFDQNPPIITNTVLNTIVEELPEQPEGPYPPHGAVNIDPSTHFNWSDAPGAAAYDFFLWPSGQSKPSQPLAENFSWSHHQSTSSLAYDTTYNWQVASKNTGGALEGPVWSFKVKPETIVEAVTADFNKDGEVDRMDLVLMMKAFINYDSRYDLNRDGQISQEDLVIFSENWGLHFSFNPTPTPVSGQTSSQELPFSQPTSTPVNPAFISKEEAEQ